MNSKAWGAGMKTKAGSAAGAALVEAYIRRFPPATQKLLQQVRATVKKAAPQAVEKIGYAMPAYELHGPLVYFAGYKNHIGLYATPSGHAEFAEALAKYKVGKGSVQFPLTEKLPLALIAKIVRFRVKENLEKLKKKKKK